MVGSAIVNIPLNPRRNSIFFGCTDTVQIQYAGLTFFYTAMPAGNNRIQVLDWDDFGDFITQGFRFIFPNGAISTILGETFIEKPAGDTW